MEIKSIHIPRDVTVRVPEATADLSVLPRLKNVWTVLWLSWDSSIDGDPVLEVGLASLNEFGTEDYQVVLENQIANGWTLTDITDRKRLVGYYGESAEQYFAEVFGQDAEFEQPYLDMLEMYSRSIGDSGATQIWKGVRCIPLKGVKKNGEV